MDENYISYRDEIMLNQSSAHTLAILLCSLAALCSPSPSSAQEVTTFLEPANVIEISAAEMGLLEHVYVHEGAEVTPGTILAQLNDDVLTSTLAISQAAVEAEGKLKLARAEVRDRKSKLDRLRQLFSRGNASQIELDRSETQLEMASAQLEQAEDEIHLKRLEIERTRQQLEQRKLRSPIHGIVTEVLKDAGEFVSISEPVIAKVVELDSLLAVFPVPQAEAQGMTVGQRIPITVGEQQLYAEAVIEYVSPMTDAQSGTRRVKVRLDNADRQWPCGGICHMTGVLMDSTSGPTMLTGKLSR